MGLVTIAANTRRSRYDVLTDGINVLAVKQHRGSTSVQDVAPDTWHEVVDFTGGLDVMERMRFQLQSGVRFRTGIILATQEVPTPVAVNVQVVETPAAEVTGKWQNMPAGQCRECDTIPVTHTGSPMCKSGSIASGGTRAHCTCDLCF